MLLTWQVESDPDDRDAETRVAAVKALAAVAQTLCTPQPIAAKGGTNDSAHSQAETEPAGSGNTAHKSSFGQVEANPAAAALVREHVVAALLMAVEDYSTDNRWAYTTSVCPAPGPMPMMVLLLAV